MSLQILLRHTTITTTLFSATTKLLDLDFPARGFHVGDSQQFVLGLVYRSLRDKNDASFTIPATSHQVPESFQPFLQDEISLVDNRLQIHARLTKFEHNSSGVKLAQR